MKKKLQQSLDEIGFSFLRAFLATFALGNITNFEDVRGVRTLVGAAVIAGAAAALRTVQALTSKD